MEDLADPPSATSGGDHQWVFSPGRDAVEDEEPTEEPWECMELPMAEPVEKLKPRTGVELAAAEGACLEAHGSPEPPAHTSSTAPADCGTSPHAATQPHSSCQSPATAVQTVAQTYDDRIPFFRSLPEKEKGNWLIAAAKRGNVGKLEALLAAGACVGASAGYTESTTLHWAARKGHEEVAKRLLAAGALVNGMDAYAWTPLHEAADQGHVAVVRLLLAAGADCNHKNDHWDTPLHLAAAEGHREVVAALLEAGADRAATNNDNFTPLQFARQEKHQLVVELLEGNSSLTPTTLPE